MDADLQQAYDVITSAICAEDVFGELNDPHGVKQPLELLEAEHKRLKALVDPALYNDSPDDKELAWDANERLEQFYQRAKERLALSAYGTRRTTLPPRFGQPCFSTERRKYFLGPPLVAGDLSDVFSGECEIGDDFAGQVAIKIIREKADNDLAQNELKVLKLLHAGGGPQRKHLPILLDKFMTDQDQLGTILRLLENSFDFTSIREKYPNGIDRKHMVWMLNRLLSAIGYAHKLGIVHGNIEPSHLMVRPKDHNLFVVDWSYAAINPKHTHDSFKVFNEDFSAPEVAKKKSPLPAADIYSIGKCMIWILGGDIKTNQLPDSVEEPLQRMLNFMTMESPLQRAQDAWKLHHLLNETVIELWGRKRFLVFEM